MYTLAISLAASRVEGIGPTRISGQQNWPHRRQDSGQGKRLKSAASQNRRVPRGLVRDWPTRGLQMDPRLEKRGERETSPEQ